MQQLTLVSAGPGDAALIAPAARAAIANATDLVAYGLYLELLDDLATGKTLHELPLGEEVKRARLALDLAASGHSTALISSGDIGVFAMATVVFELLDRHLQGDGGHAQWGNIDISVIPGISAMQAAASRTGALLGHDFCAISLSDLLTPWQTIERRIKAAADADFVVSFYNPVSKKRDWQLERARDILLERRPAQTPVVLGRNLTRSDESITLTTLGNLSAKGVDMLTLVSIGNSETRRIDNNDRSWVYTPRGYSKKL